ncbi:GLYCOSYLTRANSFERASE [Salix purpurea]|uniref:GLYCOSYLTRANSFERASE n=1 Tax=Salix purpurea TaxID=77065 RepID=A0A9Q0ZMU4_SALPP|nr:GLYCOSYLTRANSFERASE [Salix purpurea]
MKITKPCVALVASPGMGHLIPNHRAWETPDISGLVDSATSIYTQLAIMMRLALPNLQAAISAMESHPVALIVDLFGTELLVLGGEFKMLKYIFITSNAWYLALNTYVPTLDKNELDKHVEKPGTTVDPGLPAGFIR